ncbi:Histidinol-phosphate aminotransferase [Desulfamplus magnetovallimortis]|uniref:Histidinol-phosphate aminotransferase n=1 Tax=Desulfamplus magnetovallimortis TaxID=1246637 RepID=A0A1W1HEI4_9BACT|nr:histidinol-phosphate transaminase [Desulfamplus magnetovallimortis]SLM30836.1 Histidinol-phosphate aminotransferase [Desulfamplus magnetovallimortis]
MNLNVPDHIMSIVPYEPGKPLDFLEREYGIQKSIKLASNENPLGTSPMAVKAISDHLSTMNRYPDGSALKLVNKLADRFNISSENIVVGNGSDDIIALLAHAFLGAGREALMPLPSFLMYEISVKASGGNPVMIPLNGLEIDLDALADSVTDKTSMVFLTNPNNPTGTFFTKEKFTAFMSRMPENLLVIVDEAYIEFARDENIYNSLENPLDDQRIVSLRTFSKAYGLAGFRVGYGVMDAFVAGVIHRIRQPFNVNSLAQVAAAAALDDHDFLEKGIGIMHQGIDFLSEELTEMDIPVMPTQANFFLMDVKQDATMVFNALLKQGIIARSMKSYGFPTYLRISAGLPDENKAFIKALKKVLSNHGSEKV